MKPTRAAAALAAVGAFVAAIPRTMKIGLVSFAGTAQVLTMPTADRDAVREALAAMPAPNGQTALGDGLRTALRMLPATGARAIVLLTDGVNNRGEDPARVVRNLQAARVALYAIGVGENALAGRALQSYAAGNGGSYVGIGQAAQFPGAFARISAAATHRRQIRDVSVVSALAGLFLLATAWLASAWAGRLSYLGEPELHEPLGHRDDAPQLRRAGRDGDRRRSDRISARMD